jgi:hypothetical protein
MRRRLAGCADTATTQSALGEISTESWSKQLIWLVSREMVTN